MAVDSIRLDCLMATLVDGVGFGLGDGDGLMAVDSIRWLDGSRFDSIGMCLDGMP
jgi:hypothetical protein